MTTYSTLSMPELDVDLVDPRQRLHARRRVHRAADKGVLHPLATAHQPRQTRSAVYADADGQRGQTLSLGLLTAADSTRTSAGRFRFTVSPSPPLDAGLPICIRKRPSRVNVRI
jgi:hypothetical protein